MQVEELSSIYSECVVFIDPVAKHKGIKAVEDYFRGLLHNADHCTFNIHEKLVTSVDSYTITWTMSYTSSRLNKNKPIKVDGISLLKIQESKIVYHRDYYDLGQMVYEHVPLIGWLIKKIKRRMG